MLPWPWQCVSNFEVNLNRLEGVTWIQCSNLPCLNFATWTCAPPFASSPLCSNWTSMVCVCFVHFCIYWTFSVSSSTQAVPKWNCSRLWCREFCGELWSSIPVCFLLFPYLNDSISPVEYNVHHCLSWLTHIPTPQGQRPSPTPNDNYCLPGWRRSPPTLIFFCWGPVACVGL